MATRKKKAEKPAAVVHQPKKTAYMLDVKPIGEQEVEALRRVIISGDLSRLTEAQQDQYYVSMCDALGVDWRLRPFDYLLLDDKDGRKKKVLYAKANLAEQLRKNNRISIGVIDRRKDGDLYVVTARAEMAGRYDEDVGIVSLAKAYGTGMANLMMKAETKAKRRVTLSICGAGMLDESEIEDIQPGADLSPEVKAHLFGTKEPAPAEKILTPAEAAAADDAERIAKEEAAKREAKILMTIEKWKKTDEGKDAMSLCLRLGYQSKTQMFEAFEKCQSDFENFYSWLRDEWAKKQKESK